MKRIDGRLAPLAAAAEWTRKHGFRAAGWSLLRKHGFRAAGWSLLRKHGFRSTGWSLLRKHVHSDPFRTVEDVVRGTEKVRPLLLRGDEGAGVLTSGCCPTEG